MIQEGSHEQAELSEVRGVRYERAHGGKKKVTRTMERRCGKSEERRVKRDRKGEEKREKEGKKANGCYVRGEVCNGTHRIV